MAALWDFSQSAVTFDNPAYLFDGTGPAPSGVNYVSQTTVAGFDYTSLITSEHAIRPKFMALVNDLANAVGNITAFVQSLPGQFDIDTAIGAQLDIVGQWVGISRVVQNVITPGFFGFNDTPGALGFGEVGVMGVGGIFYELGSTYGASVVLNDAQYRQVLYAQIATNQSNGTAADLAQAVIDITGVQSYIRDLGNLNPQIVVNGLVSPVAQSLLLTPSLLPLPAGVALAPIDYVQIPLSATPTDSSTFTATPTGQW